MSDKKTYSVELKEEQWAYLSSMAKKYDLEDASKAIRCLVDFARVETKREKELFDEVRCLGC